MKCQKNDLKQPSQFPRAQATSNASHTNKLFFIMDIFYKMKMAITIQVGPKLAISKSILFSDHQFKTLRYLVYYDIWQRQAENSHIWERKIREYLAFLPEKSLKWLWDYKNNWWIILCSLTNQLIVKLKFKPKGTQYVL